MIQPRITMKTDYGTLTIFERSDLFEALLKELVAVGEQGGLIALTGGSTPKSFYQWAATQPERCQAAFHNAKWSVSDERHVPHTSDDSNWGTACRMLLDPLKVPTSAHVPWPTDLPPSNAATSYTDTLTAGRVPSRQAAYDLCLLGMGDDCHTASLWPGCELLQHADNPAFAATHWPERGDRLTITPQGLQSCSNIIILVTGSGKADALHRVFNAPHDPIAIPVHCLRACPQVRWWLDAEAASKLA